MVRSESQTVVTRLDLWLQLQFVIFLILLLTPTLPAETNTISFDHLSIENGLSQSTIWCIYQDSQGFMWFGTNDGLNRYDGYNFRTFRRNPDDSLSIGGNQIWSITEDRGGMLWIATFDGGLNKYDPATESFQRYIHHKENRNSLRSNHIYDICLDKTGGLWVATLNGGLSYLDSQYEKFTHYDNPEEPGKGISENTIFKVLEDESGKIWIGTFSQGVDKFDPVSGVFTHYRHNPADANSLSDNDIKAIYEDRQGIIWIGTFGGGLNRFDPATETFQHFRHDPGDPLSLNDNDISAIFEDSSGQLWVGTVGGGLHQFFPGDNMSANKSGYFVRHVHDPDSPGSLSDNDILSIYQDRSGTLWFGTLNAGINSYNRTSLKFPHVQKISSSRGLSENNVFALCENRSGQLWVGTFGGGLNWFPAVDQVNGGAAPRQPTAFLQAQQYQQSQSSDNSISSNDITAITEDRYGFVWIGTLDGGLNLLDPKTKQFTVYKNDPAVNTTISHNFVFTILEDHSGQIWVGTYGGGLNRLDRKTGSFVVYRHDPANQTSIGSDNIYTIYEDRSTSLWIGTYGGGLNRLEHSPSNHNPSAAEQRFKRYLHDPNDSQSLSNNNVSAILEDSAGQLWIGTEGGGLNRLDRKAEAFIHYLEKDGLPNNVIYGVVEDKNRQLWISTNQGLCKLDPERTAFRNYDTSDGLQSNEFNIGAAHVGHSGRVYFGGINGFNVFHPDSIRENKYLPPVVLTDFQLFNQSVRLTADGRPVRDGQAAKDVQATNRTKKIQLSYQDKVFSFEFAGLNFSSPEENQFAYMLEGFDQEWIYSGTRRFVTYTNLNPGKYVFRAKASNNDGLWNNSGMAIEIIIVPPFWATWWFRLLVIFLFGTAIYGWQRLRTQNITRQKQKLETLVAERTLELSAQKALVEQQKEKLQEVDRLKSRFFANISHEFRTPLTLILGPLNSLIKNGVHQARESDFLLMRNNAQRLLNLINQLLDLSKLESGKMTLELSQLELVGCLQQIVMSFAPLAERKSISLGLKIDQEHLFCLIDRDKFEKIVYNLISNAFKSTPKNGRIVVRASATEDYLQISIKDSGPGIPEHQLNRIFERFYRIESPHSQSGTGIGLALVRELTELHGGAITVNSQQDKGSEFIVRLPLLPDRSLPDNGSAKLQTAESAIKNPEPAAVIAEQTVPGRDLAAKTPDSVGENGNIRSGTSVREKPIVLIVEDNPEVLRFIQQQLTDKFRIVATDSGEAGYKKCLALIPDLVVSDLMMPGMDGNRLCSLIKGHELTSHIPVILLTAKASQSSKLQGLRTGADDYLTKPFDPAELETRVQNLISQRRHLRQKFAHQVVESPVHEISAPSTDKAFLERVCKAIELKMSDPDFGVEGLGREVGISRKQLHRKLRGLTDQSPSQLIRLMRLKRARQLLSQKAGSVSEIAYSVGFNHLSYFSKCFREQYGCLPSEHENSGSEQ